MELILLILAILFLLWRVKSANDEAFPPDYSGGNFYGGLPSGWSASSDASYKDGGMGRTSGFSTSEGSTGLLDSYENRERWESSSSLYEDDDHYRRWHEDNCDLSRALWDPSCPMYHVFHHDDHSSSSNWDDSWSSSSWNDSWSSSGWDSGSSSWDSWSSSSWDS
ncbi:MAG: hypothetical protein ACK42C_07860 [Aquificaceae bacterium]|uniref:hypothetical protein n=1 Tax=Hydrogenobacter sp. Uz 6-8 TaxID=3384828 RepID=UPI003099629D